jgi:hypothetical protein
MSFMALRIVGDDSYLAQRLRPGQELTAERYERLRDTFIDLSAQNGLLIKKTKAVMRKYFTEYLQKMYCHGVYLPKLIIQLFGSEKVARGESSVNMMRSHVGKMNSVVGRGISDEFMTTMMHFLWGFKRSQTNVRSENADETYYKPFASYYVTVAQKGIGRLPFTVAGANVDTTIVHNYYHVWDDDERDTYDAAAAVLGVKEPALKQELAKMVNSDSPDVYPVDPFAKGRAFVRTTQLESRVIDSMHSDAVLRMKGMKVGRYVYSKYAESFMEDALGSNKELRIIDLASKSIVVASEIQAAAKGLRSSMIAQYTWVKGFKVTYEEALEPMFDARNLNPLTAFPPKMQVIAAGIGFAQSRDLFKVRASKILSVLRQDPYMRRDLREESIIELLSDPKVFADMELMVHVLVAIGARRDLAAQVASMFISRASSFIFKANLSGLSLADAALSHLDLSLSNHLRVVSIPVTTSVQLDDLLLMHGMAVMVLDAQKNGVTRKVKIVEMYDGATNDALKVFLGGQYIKAAKYISFYFPNE